MAKTAKKKATRRKKVIRRAKSGARTGRKSNGRVVVTISMRTSLANELNEAVDEINEELLRDRELKLSRNLVIQSMVRYGLDNFDEIFSRAFKE